MSTDKPSDSLITSSESIESADAHIVIPAPRRGPAPQPPEDESYMEDYGEDASDEAGDYTELYGTHDESSPAEPESSGTPPAVIPPPPPEPPAVAQPAANPDPPPHSRSEMTLWDHLEELRGTLIKSIIALVLGTIVVGFFFSQMNDALLWPLQQAIEGRPDREQFLRMNTMFGVFSVIIEIALVGGFMLALPFVLYFFARFVAPGLTQKERGVLFPTCLAAVGLFLFGACFSYFFLLPLGIKFALMVNESMGFFLQPNVQDYYNLIIWMIGGVGLVFEFPLLLLLLFYLEILTPKMLKEYRRYVIVGIFIVSAIATPPDGISMVVMAIPLTLLYEATLVIGQRIVDRKHAAQD